MPYLDDAATAPVHRSVLEAMWPWLTAGFGNPASHHSMGDEAARALDGARRRIARLLGCAPGEVVLTSGGTEGDNLAVKGAVLASNRGRHVVTSAIEHPAVLESCRYLERWHGATVTVLPVDGDGLVSPDDLTRAIRTDTALVSVMTANNEVGTVQPVASLAAVAAARGVPFHTDAVQAAPWSDVGLDATGASLVTIAGHKLGTPKGIGALAVRRRVPLEPLLSGGGHQGGLRSGTEDVAGAVALATALDLAADERDAAPRVAALRDRFIADVLARIPGARLTGHPSSRLPGSASFCFEGVSGESLLVDLDGRGVLASSGSACAAGSDEPSAVLTAMGVPRELAQTALRFTFGRDVTAATLDAAASELVDAVAGVRALGR